MGVGQLTDAIFHTTNGAALLLEFTVWGGGFTHAASCFIDRRGAAGRVSAVRPRQSRGVPMIWGLLILIGLFLLCGAFIGAADKL